LQSIAGKILSTCTFTVQQKMAPAPNSLSDAGAISAAFSAARFGAAIFHRSRAGSIALPLILAHYK
jgi:hypothetical protein